MGETELGIMMENETINESSKSTIVMISYPLAQLHIVMGEPLVTASGP